MGFPFEGPAPLEAIMKGCYFLNAKLIPSLSKLRFSNLLLHSPKGPGQNRTHSRRNFGDLLV